MNRKEKEWKKRKVITRLIGAPSVASDALCELVNRGHRHFLSADEAKKVRSGEKSLLGTYARQQAKTTLYFAC